MAFANSLTNAAPPDTGERPARGASRIRTLVAAIAERFGVDHYLPANDPSSGLYDNADSGEHSKVTLREMADPATVAANKGVLYVKEVGGYAVVCFMDENEDICQLTASSGTACALNLSADAISNAAAAILDGTYVTHTAGVITLTAGALESAPGANDSTGITADKLDPTPTFFCDDSTLEIHASNGLQLKTGYLATVLGQSAQAAGSSDISQTTGAMADMTDMSVAVTTTGRPVLIMFNAAIRTSTGGQAAAQICVDGAAVVATLCGEGRYPMSLQWLVTPAAGAHTFKVQWQDVQGTVYQDGSTYKRVLTVIELPAET